MTDSWPADAFERLWTPHRMTYIRQTRTDGCPFCEAPSFRDEERLIVARGEHVYVLLNLFPYNPGHLLICPYRHVANYVDLTAAEREETASFTACAMRALTKASDPSGFNTGMNTGELAGAGIAEHVHQHVVPRWRGDANFLPIIAKTKALPELLGDTHRRLVAAWRQQVGEDAQ